MAKVGRPRKYNHEDPKDVELLWSRIAEYFEECDGKKEVHEDNKGRMQIIVQPYSILGLCEKLEITRETLNQYSKVKEFSDIITYARERIEQGHVENGLKGLTNPKITSLVLSANYGMSEKQQIEQNSNITVSFNIPRPKKQDEKEEDITQS